MSTPDAALLRQKGRARMKKKTYRYVTGYGLRMYTNDLRGSMYLIHTMELALELVMIEVYNR